MKSSLISALCGWITAAFAFSIAEFIQPTYALGGVPVRPHVGEIPGLFIVAALYSAPFILAVWLLLLWPLYRFTRSTSLLWRPAICIASGVIAGAILYSSFLFYLVQSPLSFAVSLRQLAIGGAVGGVTCAVGVYLRLRDTKSPNQSMQRTPTRRSPHISHD